MLPECSPTLPRPVTRTCWAFIEPEGRVLADTTFHDESHAWTIGLGWPGPGEILLAKNKGYRVCQVTITIPPNPIPVR